ncbi:hypothetical protein HDE_10259 [Halotydeus destructor]|nr:hypothetical protein HDE_10259 [Halotydeus destructor]
MGQLLNINKNSKNVKAENDKLRKVINQYQQVLNKDILGEPSSTFQCPYCPKYFSTAVFLKGHIDRRHMAPFTEMDGVLKLGQRVNELYDQCTRDKDKEIELISNELKIVKEKLDMTELELEREKERRTLVTGHLNIEMESRIEAMEDMWRTKLKEVLKERDQYRHKETPVVSDSNENQSTFEKLMLMHTKEVQKLGTNIEYLASKIAETYPKMRHVETKSQPMVRPLDDEEKKVSPRNHLNGKDRSSTPVAIIDEHDPFTRRELEFQLNGVLKSLGIPSSDHQVSEVKFLDSFKKLKKGRRGNADMRKAVVRLVENEIRTREEPHLSNQWPGNHVDTVDNILDADAELETIADNSYDKKRGNIGISTQEYIDAEHDVTPNGSPDVANTERFTEPLQSDRTALKSALKKPKEPNQPESKAKSRRISFSETRSEREFTPENSSESDVEELILEEVQNKMATSEQGLSVQPLPRPRTIRPLTENKPGGFSETTKL